MIDCKYLKILHRGDEATPLCALGWCGGAPTPQCCENCISKQMNNMAARAAVSIVPLNRLPNVADMGRSLAKSSVSWAKSGFKISEQPEVEQRLEICRGCEHWDSKAFNGTGRCLKCGCSTWAKIRLATEKCPIGKW